MSTCDLLLVEDDAATGCTLMELLTRAGISASWTLNAANGIESLHKMPAVVLVDLAGSPQGSINVLTEIRKIGCDCKIGIVLSDVDKSVFKHLSSLRPDRLFGRPLDFSALVDWLCQAFPESQSDAASG